MKDMRHELESIVRSQVNAFNVGSEPTPLSPPQATKTMLDQTSIKAVQTITSGSAKGNTCTQSIGQKAQNSRDNEIANYSDGKPATAPTNTYNDCLPAGTTYCPNEENDSVVPNKTDNNNDHKIRKTNLTQNIKSPRIVNASGKQDGKINITMCTMESSGTEYSTLERKQN